MLYTFFATLVRVAIVLGMAFIFSGTAAVVRNKPCRFALLFALGIPLNLVLNYFDGRFTDYPKVGWTGIVVIALLLAAHGTFFPRQRDNPNAT